MEPSFVYRCFNAEGEAIYVGRTTDWKNRQYAHRNAAEWWPEVDRVVVSKVLDKERAVLLETRLIQRHQPRYNVQHNPALGPVVPHLAGLPVNRTTYNFHGCRCPACRASNALYRRERRQHAPAS